MKKNILVLASLLFSIMAFAQVPEGFNYQAIVRNAAGQEITSQSVGMQISILQYTAGGTAIYVERFTPMTNDFGLVNLVIGTGSVQTGTFSNITWDDGPYFLKVEMDESGFTSYVDMGTTQLLSVPYAFHAKTATGLTNPVIETDPVYSISPAANISETNKNNWNGAFGWGDHSIEEYLKSFTELDPIFSAWDKSTDISITENQISDFGTYESAFTKSSAFNKDFGNTPGAVTQGNDSRLTDARTPIYHAESHTDGTDNIQNATDSQKGLMTATYATKLEGIEVEATADMTSEELLNSILSIDGDGSGLDADRLDGFDSSEFLKTSEFNAHPTSTVTSENISNWNTSYGWGTHQGLYAVVDHTHSSSVFPPGSIPIVFGEAQDFLNNNFFHKPFPSIASDIGTSNSEIHNFLDQIRYAGNNIDWLHTFGGDNYANGTEDRSWAAVALFIKNTTSSPITKNMCFALSSSSWGNNHCSIALNGTDVWTYTSNNIFTSYCIDISFPANSTSVLVIKSGSYTWTAWNGYWNRILIGILGTSLNLPVGLEFDYQRYSEFISNQ